MWPFSKKPKPPTESKDRRNWNEDWKAGDTAECIAGPDDWHPEVKPWQRLKKGDRFIVSGFDDRFSPQTNARYYWLVFEEVTDCMYSTTAFRKVRPLKKSEERKASKDKPVTADPQWWLDQEPVEEDA